MSKTREELIEEKLYSDNTTQVNTKKCPNCGGETAFDARKQKVQCEYCGSTFDVTVESTVNEKEINELMNDSVSWEEVDVYQCATCGAKQIISQLDVAHECSFCGTTHITKTSELPGLKPQGVVPFKMPIDNVAGLATKWTKKRFMAPRAFKKAAKPENIHGVYNPVFTFDCDTRTDYEGRLGERVGTGEDSRIRYFNVKGNINVTFDDLLVQASSNITTTTLGQLAPFSTNNAPSYNEDYLRGFKASTYNKDGKACIKEGQDLMQGDIRARILRKYTYDVVDYLNLNTAYLKQKYKYVLVPVYVGHQTYRGKLYNFYVNGETGKVTGKTPVSVFKVTMIILFVLAFIGGIVYLANFAS